MLGAIRNLWAEQEIVITDGNAGDGSIVAAEISLQPEPAVEIAGDGTIPAAGVVITDQGIGMQQRVSAKYLGRWCVLGCQPKARSQQHRQNNNGLAHLVIVPPTDLTVLRRAINCGDD